MDLLSEWSKAATEWNDSPPFTLEADADFLESYPTLMYRGEEEARQAQSSPDHIGWTDKSFHLGLLPIPFMGDLLNASIYVLMNNPGFSLDDYRECERPDFRRALLANLKQERLDGVLPFLYLDSQFDWHGGYRYWNRKLRKTIQKMAEARGISEPEARTEMGNNLAVIQRVPYHSAVGPSDNAWLKRWSSVRLAGEYVRDTVAKRIRDKQAVVIALRGVKRWNQYLPTDLTEEHGVTRLPSAEARAASLSPTSRGGNAILRHLGAIT